MIRVHMHHKIMHLSKSIMYALDLMHPLPMSIAPSVPEINVRNSLYAISIRVAMHHMHHVPNTPTSVF